MNIALKLRATRRKRKLTQLEVAEAIGVSRSTLARWERCEAEPTRRHTKMISQWLRLPDYGCYVCPECGKSNGHKEFCPDA